MQQHDSKYFARRHALDPRVGPRGQNDFILKVVMLHIKLKGKGHRASCKHIFCPDKHPRPFWWGQKLKTFSPESSHVAYQT